MFRKRPCFSVRSLLVTAHFSLKTEPYTFVPATQVRFCPSAKNTSPWAKSTGNSCPGRCRLATATITSRPETVRACKAGRGPRGEVLCIGKCACPAGQILKPLHFPCYGLRLPRLSRLEVTGVVRETILRDRYGTFAYICYLTILIFDCAGTVNPVLVLLVMWRMHTLVWQRC